MRFHLSEFAARSHRVGRLRIVWHRSRIRMPRFLRRALSIYPLHLYLFPIFSEILTIAPSPGGPRALPRLDRAGISVGRTQRSELHERRSTIWNRSKSGTRCGFAVHGRGPLPPFGSIGSRGGPRGGGEARPPEAKVPRSGTPAPAIGTAQASEGSGHGRKVVHW